MLDTVKINHVQHISFTQSRLTDAVSVILSELLSYEHPSNERGFLTLWERSIDMRFTSNDLSDAYVTQQEVNASEGSYTFNDLCTNEHCLEAINSLSTAKKKKFFKILKQAVEKIPFPDDCSEYILEDDYNEAKNAFYARLEDYFAEFM